MSEETKMANGTRQETIGNPLCLTGKLFFLGIAKDSLKADVTRVIEALGGSVIDDVDKRLFAVVTDLFYDADICCWIINSADRQTVDDVTRRLTNRPSDVLQQKEEVMVTRSVPISKLPPGRGRDMVSAAREKGLQQLPSPSPPSQVIPPGVTGHRPMASSDQSLPTPAVPASLPAVGRVELQRMLQDIKEGKFTATRGVIRLLCSDILTQEQFDALCLESEMIGCHLSRATQLEVVVMSAETFLQEHRDLFNHIRRLPRNQWLQVAPLIAQSQIDNKVIGIRVEDVDRRFRPLFKTFSHVQHIMSSHCACDITVRSKAVPKDFVPTPDPSILPENTLGAFQMSLHHQTGLKASTVDMKVLRDLSCATGRVTDWQSPGITRKGHDAGLADERRLHIQERRWEEDLPPTHQGAFGGLRINQKENEGTRKHSKHHKKEASRRWRRRQANIPSHCGCCRQTFVDMEEHLQQSSHLRFMKDARNYMELNKFFDTVPRVEDFLSKFVREPCSSASAAVGEKKSTDFARHTVRADTAPVMDTTARQGVVRVSEGASKLDISTSNVSSVERYTDAIETWMSESPLSTEEESTTTPTWTLQIKASPIGSPGPGGQEEPSIKLIFHRTRPPAKAQTTDSSKHGGGKPSTRTSGGIEPSSSSQLHINSGQTAVPPGEVSTPDSLSAQPPSVDFLLLSSPLKYSYRDQVLGFDSSSSSDLKPVSKGEKERVAESLLCSFKDCSISGSLDHDGLSQSNGDRLPTNRDLISGKGMSDMDGKTTHSTDEVVWTGNTKDAHTKNANNFTGNDDRARAQNELLQYGRQPSLHEVSEPAVSSTILMSGRRGGSNNDFCQKGAKRRDRRKIAKMENTIWFPPTAEPNDEGARPHDRENTIEQTRGIAVKVDSTSGRARPRKLLSGLEMMQILNEVKAENESCDRPTDVDRKKCDETG